mgnify:CR=1 FL=1
MKIALIGATGMVGGEILDLIKERNLLFEELFLRIISIIYPEIYKFFQL